MQSFFELRTVLEQIQHDTNAALAFMDRTGLALQTTKRGRLAGANGNGSGRINVERLREKATEMFQARRSGGKRAKRAKANGAEHGNGNGSSIPLDAPLPDGTNVTVKEAAKILKCSDANVRLMMNDGRLPHTSYERRGSKARPDVKLKVMVIPKEDVIRFRDEQKAAAAS